MAACHASARSHRCSHCPQSPDALNPTLRLYKLIAFDLLNVKRTFLRKVRQMSYFKNVNGITWKRQNYDIYGSITRPELSDNIHTFAPIWFPHCPAWMWTISLMVSCGCVHRVSFLDFTRASTLQSVAVVFLGVSTCLISRVSVEPAG